MRNDSFWSIVVFEKEVIFDEYDFETSELVFSSIIISQLRRPIEFKFSQVCYFVHMLRYTKWEDWSLTITKGVKVFKHGWIMHSCGKTMTVVFAVFFSTLYSAEFFKGYFYCIFTDNLPNKSPFCWLKPIYMYDPTLNKTCFI